MNNSKNKQNSKMILIFNWFPNAHLVLSPMPWAITRAENKYQISMCAFWNFQMYIVVYEGKKLWLENFSKELTVLEY